jgi:hypothetical protein
MSIDETIKALGAPFPAEAVKQRLGGGGSRFSYVAGPDIIRRLTRATAGEWSWHIKSFEFRPLPPLTDRRTGELREQSLVVVMGELTIPGLGTRAGIGVQKVSEAGGEDLVKGASTDALKKAATLFGVALELYGPDFEEDDTPPTPPPARTPPPFYAAPQPRTATEAPPQVQSPQPPPKHAPRSDEDYLAIVNDDTRVPERRVMAAKHYVAQATDAAGVQERVLRLTSLPVEERDRIRDAALDYLRTKAATFASYAG